MVKVCWCPILDRKCEFHTCMFWSKVDDEFFNCLFKEALTKYIGVGR